MKWKLKLIAVFVLIASAIGATLYLTRDKAEENLISLEQGQKYQVGNKIVPVYYGEELQKIIKSEGDVIVLEQEDRREFIYDQSTWEWMPIISDKKKSVVVNKITMNTKYLINSEQLDIDITEDNDQIIFAINLDKKDLIKDIKKDVNKSGIDWNKTVKGNWGKDLRAEVTEKDEKDYRLELSEKEITDKQLFLAKQNLIQSLTVLLEESEVEKKIIIE